MWVSSDVPTGNIQIKRNRHRNIYNIIPNSWWLNRAYSENLYLRPWFSGDFEYSFGFLCLSLHTQGESCTNKEWSGLLTISLGCLSVSLSSNQWHRFLLFPCVHLWDFHLAWNQVLKSPILCMSSSLNAVSPPTPYLSVMTWQWNPYHLEMDLSSDSSHLITNCSLHYVPGIM